MTGIEQPAAAAAPTSTPHVRVVPHAEWDALVARLGGDDVYLRLGYHVASAHLEPDHATAVLLHMSDPGGEVALPLLLRPLPDGHSGLDATSAYGYGGPVALGAPDLDAFASAFDEWALANDVVATFLRFHPLLGNVRLAPTSATVVELGGTVAWDVVAERGGIGIADRMLRDHYVVDDKAVPVGPVSNLDARQDTDRQLMLSAAMVQEMQMKLTRAIADDQPVASNTKL